MGIIKDPTSWRTGFELGLAGFSFPYSKPRKPTAYLYNGIRLPALPEWDRGVYPYAFIRDQELKDGNHMYTLYISAYPFNLGAIDTNGEAYIYNGGPRKRYEYRSDNEEMTWGSELSSALFSVLADQMLWADHVIEYSPELGGGVFRYASPAPIPVYE